MTRVAVAIVQQPPAVLDLAEGVRRAVTHVEEAARTGAQVVVFSETWLGGYPAWVYGMAGWNDPDARYWYGRLVEASATVDGTELEPLRAAARRHRVVMVMGMNERAGAGGGSIYNTLLTLGQDGQTLLHHRKLVPTHAERIVWSPGRDGSSLRVAETGFGRIGGLVCWENWMPLVRQALHGLDEQLHVAVWPDMTPAHELASRHYAFEGRCFVLAAAQYLDWDDVPEPLHAAYLTGLGPDATKDEPCLPGGCAIAAPDGSWLIEPVYGKAATVHAEIDLDDTVRYKYELDVAGHYARPDILQFSVDRRPRAVQHYLDDPPPHERAVAAPAPEEATP